MNPIPAASSLVVSKDPIDPVLQTTIEEFEVIFDKAVATTKTSKESHELPTPVRLTARLTDPSDANFYDILKKDLCGLFGEDRLYWTDQAHTAG